MRQFIIKISCWFFLFIFIYFILGFAPFLIYDHSYPIYKSQLEFIKSDSAETLFIGDSRVNASVIANNIPNSRNLGIPASSPIDGYFLLKKYLDNHKKVKNVFISYSWENLGNQHNAKNIYRRGVLLGFYEYKEYIQILERSRLIDNEFNNKMSWVNFISAYTRSPIFMAVELKKFSFSNYKTNKEIYQLLNFQKGHITTIFDNQSTCIDCKGFNARTQDFSIDPIYDYYFKELIHLCISNNIKVFFETIPFNRSSLTSNHVVTQYKQYLRQLTQLYPSARISDTIFYYDDKYYESTTHMNSSGAIEYTKYLRHKILSD